MPNQWSLKAIQTKLPLHLLSPKHVIPTSATHSFSFSHNPQTHLSLVYTLHLLRTTPPHYASVTSLHALALKLSAPTHPHTATSLLVLYAKSQNVLSAWKLFEEMPTRDVISWNAMINAAVRNNHLQVALDLFLEMRRTQRDCGIDSTTLVILVSGLSKGLLRQCGMLHGLSLKYGMGSDCFLCNAFIDVYAKCGELSCAECVFEGMEFRDVSSWNSVMSGCVYNGRADKCLRYFKEMGLLCGAFRADHFSISSAISACSSLGELHFGQAAHGLAVKLGFEGTDQTSVGNALISFYSHCGEIKNAELVFRELNRKDDVISWNSFIQGFAAKGMVLQAFDLLCEMQLIWSIIPDSVTLISILPLCAEFKLLCEGRSVHGFIIRKEMTLDLSLKNSLMDMYSKCNTIKTAELLFSGMDERDIVSWNTMIAGYAQNNVPMKAQALFQELVRTGPSCNVTTLLAVLPACDSHKELHFGQSVHSLKVKMGFTSNSLAINALMFMYINCGDLVASLRLLQSISAVADIVSWNTVIVGCAQNGNFYEALETFNQMCSVYHLKPDTITLVSVLSACGDLQLVSNGRSIHGFTLKTPVGCDVRVRNSLITMYSRFEDTKSASLVFATSSHLNLCTWNCMLSGLAHNNNGQRALEVFSQLEYIPNEFTIVSILSACTQVGSLRHGKQLHGYVLRFGLESNLYILTALVDMYSKCGRLEVAVQIFKDLPEKTAAFWNCMISAYGLHGHGREAIKLFTQMCESDARPTKSTFISLLSACSHSGLIDEGCSYYERMPTEFEVEPTVEHHVCVVDMLGRAGRLVDAYKFTEGLQPSAERGVWGALVSACKNHGDVKMGKQVAEHLFKIDPQNAGYYVSLFNIYATDGRWNDAMDLRRLFDNTMLKKPPGYSLVAAC